MGRKVVPLVGLAVTAAALGCRPGREAGPRALPASLPRCVLLAGIDSWKRLDDSTVVLVETGSGRRLRVRTAVACHGLRRAETLRLETRQPGLLCADPGDRLMADDQECGIADVRWLDQDGE